MKKTILTLCCIIICLVVNAQHNYEIYDYQGVVMYKARQTATWLPLTKHLPVSILDSVDIQPKACLRIINVHNNQLCQSVVTGKMRIKSIIDEALRQDDKVWSTLNKQLLNNLKEQSTSNSMSVIGATTRGDNKIDSIAETFLSIAQEVIKGIMPPNNSALRLIPHEENNELWFSLVNNSNSDYYVNILCINKKQNSVSLSYSINPVSGEMPFILLPAGQSVHLKHFVFLQQPDVTYLMIATADAYDTYQMSFQLTAADLNQSHLPIYTNYTITY